MPGSDATAPATRPTVRCAIYTRKSTEDGLEQEFNSLDAQRESAESYIASMKHEQWVCLAGRYDDGGFSGGSMDRPGLHRLMQDVAAGQIDCIVVYKVDRLSRSLLDFSKIMETLDRHAVSFVSVTQQFNTTHSMGRLTLNILLSFAQFEREIITERTRDKMAAARKKGKWTGGMPMLGYDVDPRGGRLIVNEDEAARVRALFDLYREKQSLLAVVRESSQRGWTLKRWITQKGHERGGRAINKVDLSKMLANVIYRGKVRYRGVEYAGEHEAIVAEDTWQAVQALLRSNDRRKNTPATTPRKKPSALLAGLLYCIPCQAAMVHSCTASRNGPKKRYRYYVCSHAQKHGWDTCPSKSLPAPAVEAFAIDRIRSIGNDPGLLSETIAQARDEVTSQRHALLAEARALEIEIQTCRDRAERPATSAMEQGEHRATDSAATAESRLRAVRSELAALADASMTDHELAAAIRRLNPAWGTPPPEEQARMLHLLLKRVGYDGATATIALIFRPDGIRQLARETDR